MPDFYELLGVTRDSGPDEIKKAFRDRALKYHPDHNAGDAVAEEQFKRINEAYSVLGDPEKKARYDLGGYTDSPRRPGEWQGSSGDPWEEFFGGNSANHWGQTSWNWTNRTEQKAEEWTRREAFEMLLRSVLSLVLGLLLFRFSLFFGIFGIVICLAAIGRGIKNTLRAIHLLFSLRE